MDNIADVIFTGQASSDLLGISVSSAGDVNNDGYSDVIIGADGNSAVGFQMGRAYLYAGSAISVGVDDKERGMPGDYRLFQNYPNPFNPLTNLGFRIADVGFVELKVYDLLGREIRTLVNKTLTPGRYEVQWDGTDNAGQPVASGVYLYRLKAGSFVAQNKLVLVR